MVADRPELTPAALQRAVHDSLERQGWLHGLSPDEAGAVVAEEVGAVRRAAAAFPVGAVLAREGDEVWRRLDVAA
jgi:hypothetical protein